MAASVWMNSPVCGDRLDRIGTLSALMMPRVTVIGIHTDAEAARLTRMQLRRISPGTLGKFRTLHLNPAIGQRTVR